jgi:hypothetical protein
VSTGIEETIMRRALIGAAVAAVVALPAALAAGAQTVDWPGILRAVNPHA